MRAIFCIAPVGDAVSFYSGKLQKSEMTFSKRESALHLK